MHTANLYLMQNWGAIQAKHFDTQLPYEGAEQWPFQTPWHDLSDDDYMCQLLSDRISETNGGEWSQPQPGVMQLDLGHGVSIQWSDNGPIVMPPQTPRDTVIIFHQPEDEDGGSETASTTSGPPNDDEQPLSEDDDNSSYVPSSSPSTSSLACLLHPSDSDDEIVVGDDFLDTLD